MVNGFQKIKQPLTWFPFVIFSFISILWITWQLLSTVNFSYPFWYRVLDVGAHIEKYAPQNRNKDNFQLTTEQERFDLFAQVVDSINNDGEGLAEISYHDPSGKVIDTLYWHDEIGHLRDVAGLVTKFDYAAYFSLLVVGLYLLRIFAVVGERPIKPKWAQANLFAASVLVLTAAAVFIIGPKAVFYWLHEVAFPSGAPWFFYYQDSLMSTAMKAPDLFGGIAAQWFGLTLLVYIVWIYSVGHLVKQKIKSSGKIIHN